MEEEKKTEKKKFPLCLKAKVIDPFGAAAQKRDEKKILFQMPNVILYILQFIGI